jgi:hypothetical protein
MKICKGTNLLATLNLPTSPPKAFVTGIFIAPLLLKISNYPLLSVQNFNIALVLLSNTVSSLA